MAEAGTFNPDVPTMQIPEDTFRFRPNPPVHPDLSGETALKGVGSMIKEGVDVGDKVQDSYIKDRERNELSSVRDDYTQRLQTVYEDVAGKGFNTVPGQPNSLLQDKLDPNKAPDQLQRRMQALKTLEGAKQSGKYDEVYLMGQYNRVLKQLRTDFPGKRDYIDQYAKEFTGVDPANKQMALMVSEINSYIGDKKDQHNKILGEVITLAGKGNVYAADLYRKATDPNNPMPPQELVSQLSRLQADDYRLDHDKKRLEYNEKEVDVNNTLAKKYVVDKVQNELSNFQNSVYGKEKVSDLLHRIETETDPERAQAELQTLARLKLQFENNMRKDFNTPDERGVVVSKLFKDQKEIEDQITAGTSYFDRYSKYLTDKESGPIASDARSAQLRMDAAFKDLVTMKDGGYSFAISAKLHQLDPLGATEWERDLGLRHANDKVSNLVNERERELAAGMPSGSMSAEEGDTRSRLTVKNIIEQGLKADMKKMIGPNATSDFNVKVVKMNDDVVAKTTPPGIRHSLAEGFYSRQNMGVMDLFPVSGVYVTPTGVRQPRLGQADVFSQWFDKSRDKYMFTQPDAALRADYVENKKLAFKTTFSGEVKTLDGLQDVSSIKIGWDDTNHHIQVADWPTTSMNPQMKTNPAPPEYYQAKEAAGRLNNVLDNVTSMAKYTKDDPDGLVLEFLKHGDLDPNGPVSKQLLAAIEATKAGGAQ